MSRPRTRVSDHALVRYMERVHGYDMEALRLAIERRIEPAALMGASGVVIDGFVYRLKRDQHGPVVTTVMPAGSCPQEGGG